MRRVLLADDDALILRLYREGFSQRGFEVATAGDGLAAITELRSRKPDIIVLDLMMPKLSGVEVLKYIRSEPKLSDLPVIILSNAYMDDFTRNAALLDAGVQRALLKVRCNPATLVQVASEILEGKSAPEDSSQMLAVAETRPADPPAPAAPPRPGPALAPPTVPPPPSPAKPTSEGSPPPNELRAKARADFLRHSSGMAAELRTLFQAFIAARSTDKADQKLEDFFRKLHFVTATAGFAECHRAAQMASVFEALLFVLSDKPSRITPSVLRTIAAAVDFLEVLLQEARHPQEDKPVSAKVLAVDDDPLSNRLVVAALHQAQLRAQSTENPNEAWEWLRKQKYDLVLLDIEMPGLDGFELCQRMRTLPAYEKTPVIYVTGHSDFEHRAKGLLSGGQDLIAKPVLPMELAVKVIMHLLKHAGCAGST